MERILLVPQRLVVYAILELLDTLQTQIRNDKCTRFRHNMSFDIMAYYDYRQENRQAAAITDIYAVACVYLHHT